MALPNPGWNVVYGEIPAASKWSQLGANDDALAAGTGMNDGFLATRHFGTMKVPTANLAGVGDYSTSEVDTGYKWTDGKAIYKRTFTGSFSGTAGTRSTISFAVSGLTNFIHSEGYVVDGDNVKLMLNMTRFPAGTLPATAPNAYTNMMQAAGGDPSLFCIPSSSGLISYTVTLYYTK